MIRAVAWKQWREQRLLAGLLLGVGAAYLILLRFTESPESQVALTPVAFTATCVAAAYGLVSGALLLAGDHPRWGENFAERLAPSRLALWAAKVLVGAGFTVLHCLLVQAVLLLTWADRLPPADLVRPGWIFGLSALVAFSWGVCASSVARSVPGALLLGGLLTLALVLGGPLLAGAGFWSEPGRPALLAAGITAGAALLLSAVRYCWDDLRRSLGDEGRRPAATGSGRAPWARWLWLGWRQSWPVLFLPAAGFAVGWWRPAGALLLWPVVTLAGGLVLGASLLEKRHGWEFLREHRLARARAWRSGTLARLPLAACFGGLVLAGIWLGQPQVDRRPGDKPPLLTRAMQIQEEWIGGSVEPHGLRGNTAVFLALWLLVGYSVGRLAILSVARKAVALGVGLPLAVLLAGVWIPSILHQGLLWWQALAPSAILLLGCVVLDWCQGAIAWRGKAVLVAGCLLVALGWVAGVLHSRATEIPDVGEPFDVAAYAGTLVPPEDDRVADLLVRTASDYRQHLMATTRRVGPPDAVPMPGREYLFPGPSRSPADNRFNELRKSASSRDWEHLYQLQLDEVHANGWPDRADQLERWVEGLAEGRWVRHLDTLKDLPAQMGIGQSEGGLPRYPFEVQGQTAQGDTIGAIREMAQLLHARALWHQRRGQFRAALDCYRKILTLYRHLSRRGGGLNWLIGQGVQSMAFTGLGQWASEVREPALLLQALQEVSRLDEPSTPLVDLVRYDYYWLVERGLSDPAASYLAGPRGDPAEERWLRGVYRLPGLVPWERERSRRYLNRLYGNILQVARRPTWVQGPAEARPTIGLPPHPVAAVTLNLGVYRTAYADGLCRLRGLRLQLALATYQARHGRCPPRLADLVPDLLEDLPVDPWTGKSFGYRISTGERIPTPVLGWGGWHRDFPYELFPVLDAFRWLPLAGSPGTPWLTVVPVVQRGAYPGLFIPASEGPPPPDDPGELVPVGRPQGFLEVHPHLWVAPGRGIVWSAGRDRQDDGGMDAGADTIFLVPSHAPAGRNRP